MAPGNQPKPPFSFEACGLPHLAISTNAGFM
jgi:hypothetical protein